MPMKKNPRTIYGFNISMNISFLFNPIWVPGQFLKWRSETDYQKIRLDLDSQTGSEQISKAGSLNSGFRPIWDQIWEVNRFYSNVTYYMILVKTFWTLTIMTIKSRKWYSLPCVICRPKNLDLCFFSRSSVLIRQKSRNISNACT